MTPTKFVCYNLLQPEIERQRGRPASPGRLLRLVE